MLFMSSADFFPKSTFLKNSSRNIIRVSNSLDPDQARDFVESDLDPNCLRRSSADDTSRQGVEFMGCLHKTNHGQWYWIHYMDELSVDPDLDLHCLYQMYKICSLLLPNCPPVNMHTYV